jgi:transcriptional regulator with GAF, ATPase, and Fis domain
MLRINCASLPETLLESELFGHTKGSFSGATSDRDGLFQAAHSGTLLLDEIGEISAIFQPKLLRVLDSGEFHRVGEAWRTIKVDVRVIAATNRDLEEAVRKAVFRADLYYRLNVVPLVIPPLRERRDDARELIDHFMRKFAGDCPLRLSHEARRAIETYSWPGNVRELANAVQHGAVLCEGNEIGIDDLPVAIQDRYRSRQLPAEPEQGTLEAIEVHCILQAMKKTDCNRTQAARLLGITRRTLGYRIRKYDLEQEFAAAAGSALRRARPVRTKPGPGASQSA